MFRDRAEAGKKLGEALRKFGTPDALVLAIPRGGVEVGWHVARALGVEFSLIIARKLPLPDSPEAGFGAVAEDGSIWLVPTARYWLSEETIEEVILRQRAEIRRRIEVLRGGEPMPEVRDRAVFLVDDGIAMGSTMRASVACCRNRGAGRIVVGAPVSGPDTVMEMREIADAVVVLETPLYFRAVAEAYENWYDVSDEEVLSILERDREEKARKM